MILSVMLNLIEAIPSSEILDLFENYFFQFAAYDIPEIIKQDQLNLRSQITELKRRLKDTEKGSGTEKWIQTKIVALNNRKIVQILHHILSQLINAPEEVKRQILANTEKLGMNFGESGALKIQKRKERFIEDFIIEQQNIKEAELAKQAAEAVYAEGDDEIILHSLHIEPEELSPILMGLNYTYFQNLVDELRDGNETRFSEFTIDPSNNAQSDVQVYIYVNNFLKNRIRYFNTLEGGDEAEIQDIIPGLVAEYMAAISEIMMLFWDESELIVEAVMGLGLSISLESAKLLKRRLIDEELEFTPSDSLIVTDEDTFKQGLYYLGNEDPDPEYEKTMDLLHDVLHLDENLKYLYERLRVVDDGQFYEYVNCLRRYAILRELEFTDSLGLRVALKNLFSLEDDDSDDDSEDPNDNFQDGPGFDDEQ